MKDGPRYFCLRIKVSSSSFSAGKNSGRGAGLLGKR